MLERGFWLYVWRIASPIGEVLYVGRTGDSSSLNASPPFMRMAQHLVSKVRWQKRATLARISQRMFGIFVGDVQVSGSSLQFGAALCTPPPGSARRRWWV